MNTNPLLVGHILDERTYAQSLTVTSCKPWYLSADYWPARIHAAGWTASNQLVIVTDHAYSVNDPVSVNTSLMVYKEFPFVGNISDDWLSLKFEEISEVIHLFGIYTGNGIVVSQNWALDIIYPWWPIGLVMISRLGEYTPLGKTRGCPIHEFAYDWFRCGFSPNGKHFVALTSEYAQVFTQISDIT